MLNLNLLTLPRYIHNLKQLQQTMLNLGLTEAAAIAGENIRLAEEYLEFLKKYRRRG